MKIRNSWGKNYMEKFCFGGAMKDTEHEAKLTPATKVSGRPVESPKKLVNTAPGCSSQRVKQETVDINLSQKLDKKENLSTTMILLHPMAMKHRKRSARQGSKSFVPWVQSSGYNFRNMARAHQNDQGSDSKKMQTTRRGTKRCANRGAKPKGNESVGGGSDGSDQPIPAKLDKPQGSPQDTNAVEHLSDPKSDTPSNSKEQRGIDASDYAFKHSGVVPADDILMNDTWIHFKKSKAAANDGLMTTTDVIRLYEAKENHSKFEPAVIPGLDLNDGNEKFDTSTAKSALASLCAASVPDACVEFAVKILKDEVPVPAQVSEVGEFTGQMACHQKRATAGTSRPAQGRKD